MREHRSGAWAAMLAGAAAGLLFTIPLCARAQEGKQVTQAKKDAVDEKTIQALIARLGDLALDERDAAAKKLTAIGEPALDLLEKAAAHDKGPEVRFTAARLIRQLGRGMVAQTLNFDGHQGTKG